MTKEIDAIVGKQVTLNGREAYIYGRSLPFAIVATVAEPMLSAEFSWPTAKRIDVDEGGRFQV